MSRSDRLLKSSLVVLAVIVVAKLFALGEDAVVASLIGTSEVADSYYMSADIIQLFWYFGSLGIVRVFLPEYKRQLTIYGDSHAEGYSRSMFVVFTAFSILITAILAILAFPITKLTAFGFSSENKSATAEFVRLRTPQILFWCWTSLITAKLQSKNRFFVSKIPEAINHLPVIVLPLFFFRRFGAASIFAGLIVGSMLGFLIQYAFSDNFRLFRSGFHLNGAGVKESLKRIPAAFVSAAMTQIHSFVDKIMASALPIGAVSSLSYGHKMYTAVNGLISSAVSTVAYPKITEYATLDDKDRLTTLVRSILSVLLFVSVPVSFGFICFSQEITRSLFLRGAFDAGSASQVAIVFSAYAFGLPCAGINSILQLLFFAYGNTKVPMLISILSIICNIILNYVFARIFGVTGIAAASSFASLISCIFLIVFLKGRIRIINIPLLVRTLRLLAFALAACCVAFGITRFLVSDHQSNLRILLGLVLGAGVYLPLVYVFDKGLFQTIKAL